MKSAMKWLGAPLLGLGLATAVVGCDGSGEDGIGVDPNAQATDKVLGSLDVGYGKITFHEVTLEDGSKQISVEESLPNSYNATPFQKLVSAGHTSLEIWNAVLPDQPAPELLMRAQVIEAAELKRPNADIVPGFFDRDAPIEKSAASCGSLAAGTVFKPVPSDTCYTYAWVNKRSSLAQEGWRSFGVIDNNGATTSSNVTMGVCNDSAVAVSGRAMVKKASDSGFVPVYPAWATIQPGYIHYWYNFSRMSLSTCPGLPPGMICLGVPLPSAYRVEGNSSAGRKYYLYTGVLQATLKSSCVPR